MKIAQFNPIKNSEVPKTVKIHNPYDESLILEDEDGVEVTFEVKGFLSQAFRQASESLDNDLPVEERRVNLLASIITGFTGKLELEDGTPVTMDNLSQLLKEEIWLTGQIEKFVTEVKNFSPKM